MSAAPPSGRRKLLASRKRREDLAALRTKAQQGENATRELVKAQQRVQQLEDERDHKPRLDPVGHYTAALANLAEQRDAHAIAIEALARESARLGYSLEGLLSSVAQAWRSQRHKAKH